MKYQVGDKVQFKNVIFIMDAEVLEVYENGEYEDLNYYIKYWNYEGEEEEILVREKDIVGFTKGTKKYLSQELEELLKIFTKDEIIQEIKKISFK